MSDYPKPPGMQQYEEKGGDNGTKIAAACGIGCLAIVLVGGLLVFLGVRAVQSRVDEFAQMAPSEPLKFEHPVVQAAEVETVVRKFDDFRRAISDSGEVPPLVLTADEINILINHHPDFQPLAGRSKVEIEGDRLTSAVSVQADKLPIEIPFLSKALQGKYLNGSATIDLSVKNGRAEMYLLDFEFNDYQLPKEILEGFKQENLLKDFEPEPEMEEWLKKIRELKIEDGKFQIIPEPAPQPVV